MRFVQIVFFCSPRRLCSEVSRLLNLMIAVQFPSISSASLRVVMCVHGELLDCGFKNSILEEKHQLQRLQKIFVLFLPSNLNAYHQPESGGLGDVTTSMFTTRFDCLTACVC